MMPEKPHTFLVKISSQSLQEIAPKIKIQRKDVRNMLHLRMAGIDVQTAKAAQREPFAFSHAQAERMLQALSEMPGISGAVLLATCNRTELYLSMEPACKVRPDQQLLTYAGQPNAEKDGLVVREEAAAALHLMEVACGLHSQILHEEQIVTQVGQAIDLARSCHSTDALLDTLFRTAVSAGKDSLTHVTTSVVPSSAAKSAVMLLERVYGSLEKKTAVVIGNGNMGRLAAQFLIERGCAVYMTMRVHHRRETVIPFGALPVLYEERFSKIDGADFVISATRSPHYTITAQQLGQLEQKPKWILDLAMPRDVEETCRKFSEVQLCNLDDFEEDLKDAPELLRSLHQIAVRYAEEFRQWRSYRDAIPYIQQLKTLTAERLLHSTALEPYRSQEQFTKIVRIVTEKTVDMIMGGMKSELSPELLETCCEKLQNRARSLQIHTGDTEENA